MIDINVFVKPLIQNKIRLRNGFKFNFHYAQDKFNRQQFDDTFFSVNRVLHFMQTASLGDSLHEMSNPVFWNK